MEEHFDHMLSTFQHIERLRKIRARVVALRDSLAKLR